MSSASTKIIQAAAGNVDGALYVEDVFSTYLYEGTSSARSITNGIDLGGEGGLVWIKNRGVGASHRLYDTNRGVHKDLRADQAFAENTDSTQLTAFNSNGFSLGADLGGLTNYTTHNFVSWTFRKAPKFFDVVTWTGNAVAGREIAHNLGTTVGAVFIKNTSNAENWMVFHRGSGIDGQLNLNTSGAATDDSSQFNDTVPSSTVLTLGANAEVNANGQTYVAYLFAHNDGDGEFGEDADQDIIKCGSFTADNAGGGSYNGAATVNLGFEPQFVIFKQVDSTLSVPDWMILDTMRGYRAKENTASDIGQQRLLANASSTETTSGGASFPTSTGFGALQLTGGATYIYIAIRRGPMKTPTLGTEVFTAATTGTSYNTEFRPENVDMAMFAKRGGDSENFQVADRVRGFQSTNTNSDDGYTTATLETNNSNAEDTSGTSIHQTEGQDSGGGPYVRSASSGSNFLMYRFKRAPGFFDVVAYDGNGVNNRQITHNLGAIPELIIIKRREDTSNWTTYIGPASSSGDVKYMVLDATNGLINDNTGEFSSLFYDTLPTSSVFTVGNASSVNRASTGTYIAYLFATLPGVSKVGSFTTTGSDLNVDCGFTNGARFILTKKTSATEDWIVFDTERGIVAGNDPFLALNTTVAEYTLSDAIDPLSSGFTLVGSFWGSGSNYIFLAIA